MDTAITQDILSRKQAAQFLGVCLTTLDRLDIPRTQVRKRVLFRKTTLEKWLEKQEQLEKRV
jgi:excisionase family DNA binding protein